MKLSALVAAIGLACMSGISHGDPTLPPWSASVTPYARQSLDADLSEGQSLSVLRAGSSFRVGGPVSESVFVALSGSGEYSNYDFSGGAANFPQDVYYGDLSPSMSFYLNENLGFFGGLVVAAGGESDASFSDALTYGAFGGVNYQISKGVWIGGGFGISTQLEDSAVVVPLVNINWAINDKLKLEFTGLSGKLSYAISDQWTVFADGQYELHQYRLADDSIVPEGVLSDASIQLGVGVSYAPSETITVSLGGGAVVWREIEFFDDEENKLSEDTADIAAYVGASVKIAF